MSELYEKDDDGVLHPYDEDPPIHPNRWRALLLWIIAFTAITFWLIGDNRHAIDDLKKAKASIHSLQNTNCRQRNFLVAAHNVRMAAANAETGRARQTDLAAATAYRALIQGYTPTAIGKCKTIRFVQLKGK